MEDKITIVVERDGEYHKFIYGGRLGCSNCSLESAIGSDLESKVCDICLLLDGCFKKVVIDEKHK